MDNKTRKAAFTLLADLLTASTAGFLAGFATTLLQQDWPTVIVSLALALLNGCATIYFRQKV